MNKKLTLILLITCIMSCVVSMQPQHLSMLDLTLHTGETVHFSKEDLFFKLNDLCDTPPEAIVFFDSTQQHILPFHPYEQIAAKQHILTALAAVQEKKQNSHFLEIDYGLLSSKPTLLADKARLDKETKITPKLKKSLLNSFISTTTLGYAACILGTYLITKHIYSTHH